MHEVQILTLALALTIFTFGLIVNSPMPKGRGFVPDAAQLTR